MLLLSFPILIVSYLAVGLDHIFSEVKRFHPLIGFGNIASFLERKLRPNLIMFEKKTTQRMIGFMAWSVSVFPFVLFSFYLQEYLLTINQFLIVKLLDILVLYFALGNSSLSLHAMNIYRPLSEQTPDSLVEARKQVSMMVSRETKNLDENEISRATVESVLENGHDAVLASLFWYAIGGAPLVILHRLANTLDAMWGYKNERYLHFGWFSARMDDCLGWPSAKITSFLYALQGLFKSRFNKAIYNSIKQAPKYKSLNGGWVMASGASVLNISLGGSSVYDDKLLNSVVLGQGKQADSSSILKSIRLVSNAVWIWLGIILIINVLIFALEQ